MFQKMWALILAEKKKKKNCEQCENKILKSTNL